jgi:rhodanese-related sulfurtransferase
MTNKLILWIALSFFTLETLVASKASTDQQRKKSVEKLIKEFEQDIPVPTITVDKLLKLKRSERKDQYLVVDVREDFERKVSAIPGSISKEDFEKNKAAFKGKKIVPYCTIGYRSAKYTKKLVSQGFDAKNMRGSILLWLHEGGEVVDTNQKTTTKVHVYGKKWDLLPSQFQSLKKKSWLDIVRGK